jgi:hypothetical protein
MLEEGASLFRADLTAADDPEPISPELALVDPELAERARRRLPERTPDPPARVPPPPAPRSLSVVPPPAPRVTRRWRSPVLAVAATLLVLGGLATDVTGIVSDKLAPSRLPSLEAAPPPERSQPAATTAATSLAPSLRGATRRFIWPPVADAQSYRVSFYRSGSLIFSAVTTQPRQTLPRSWTYDGKRYRLTKGTYRWVVVPRVRASGGLRDGKAVVDASYTV